MIAPHDIWFDSTLTHVVPVGTPGAYLIRRKGDRISGLDAARFGLRIVQGDALTRPVAVDDTDVRTAALASPPKVGSPKRRRR